MSLPELPSLLRRVYPEARLIYLFGSAADGTEHAESDIDLAVLGPEALPPVDRFDMQERLASALGRDVDLVDLHAASTVFRARIVSTGRVLYEADPVERATFEMNALSAYALLNEERAGILDSIRVRGTVHG